MESNMKYHYRGEKRIGQTITAVNELLKSLKEGNDKRVVYTNDKNIVNILKSILPEVEVHHIKGIRNVQK